MSCPEDLKYSSTHEWARVEGDVVTVGITAYAIEQLSELAFVDLPEEGTTVERSSRFGEIESTKTVSDLLAPVSGEIIAVNTEVVDNLQLLSGAPYEGGWLIKIRMSHPEEVSSLLDSTSYEAQLETEEQH